MKKFTLILAMAVVLAVIVAPTIALANNGPHGGFVADTDMCAACHRAHTAPSSVTWTDNQGEQRNALLVSDSAESYQFCLACHGNDAQGADTNVMGGTYEGSDYGTPGADMISGAFGIEDGDTGVYLDSHNVAVTSSHIMNGQSWGAYAGGAYGNRSIEATGNYPSLQGTGAKIVMDCTTCHDPHGSSNYRILKDMVYGVAVGGYSGGTPQDPNPTPYVVSNETNYPVGGFRLHTQYGTYDPDYTVAQYAKAPGGDRSKGMSGWCAGCHTAYGYDGGANPDLLDAGDWTGDYNAGDGLGFVTRHRHPINVEMSNFSNPASPVVLNSGLPLAHSAAADVNSNDPSDWIDCMTCHNAHGTTAVMDAGSYADPNGSWEIGDAVLTMVTPDSALLKMDNRGVCEACHNK